MKNVYCNGVSLHYKDMKLCAMCPPIFILNNTKATLERGKNSVEIKLVIDGINYGSKVGNISEDAARDCKLSYTFVGYPIPDKDLALVGISP